MLIFAPISTFGRSMKFPFPVGNRKKVLTSSLQDVQAQTTHSKCKLLLLISSTDFLFSFSALLRIYFFHFCSSPSHTHRHALICYCQVTCDYRSGFVHLLQGCPWLDRLFAIMLLQCLSLILPVCSLLHTHTNHHNIFILEWQMQKLTWALQTI